MKKKLMILGVLAIVIALAIGATVFAAAGDENASENTYGTRCGYGRGFTTSVSDYDTIEEYHAAMVAEKLAIIEEKVADGTLSREDADAIIEKITDCDTSDCTLDGPNPDRFGEGLGIFGRGSGLGTRMVSRHSGRSRGAGIIGTGVCLDTEETP